MSDLDSVIEQAANEPQAASVDGQSFDGRSLPDLIEADKYLRDKAAAAARGAPTFRIAKMIPPGMAD